MAFTITVDQQFDASVAYIDAAGNPAAVVDGMPTWASSDNTILAVQASADGMSCVAAAVGPVGAAQLSVTADADLGAGLREVIALLDVTIVGGEAVAAVITPGEPTDKLTVQPVTP